MQFCSKCGNEMSDTAVYCERCGFRREDNVHSTGVLQRGEIVRSTQIFTGQQILISAIIFVGLGLMILMMTFVMPQDQFFDNMRFMPFVMGSIMIGIGLAIYFLGNAKMREG